MRVSQLLARAAPGLVLLALWSACVLPLQAVAQETVDLELALMVDVSDSVSDEEFRLQAEGLAAALSSDPVIEAIEGLRNGLALAVMQWGNADNQHISQDWVLLRGRADAEALAARIAVMPRAIQGGHTAISNALVFGTYEIQNNAFEGLRKVIDLSGDGRNNDGFRLSESRELAFAAGIVINGLPILNELPQLDEYFEQYVIGGEGAFLIIAEDYPSFAAAMTRKLVKEIGATPISSLPRSGDRQTAQSD